MKGRAVLVLFSEVGMEITKAFEESVIEAVRSCKSIMMRAFTVKEKGNSSNLVTSADTAVQEKLKELLGKILPQAGFLGEEAPADAKLGALYWVVDPIDGTSNFVRDMRLSAFSVALVENGEEVLGVVYNPFTDDLFWAAKGKGAYWNGKPLAVSRRDLGHAVIFTAFSVYEKKFAPQCMEVLRRLYPVCDDFRRLGAASLELCYLAAGRAELYFEMRLFPWDWAAAAVILREAGGVIGTIPGERLLHDAPCLVLAANHAENFRVLQETVASVIPVRPYIK